MATSAPTAVDYSKILRQVEFYFSDQSLRKDKFMNEKIAENVEGAVSLDVLLTFNRLKTLTTDKSVVIEALKPSTFLEVVNDNMVKRSDPFNSENVKDALPATIYVVCCFACIFDYCRKIWDKVWTLIKLLHCFQLLVLLN